MKSLQKQNLDSLAGARKVVINDPNYYVIVGSVKVKATMKLKKYKVVMGKRVPLHQSDREPAPPSRSAIGWLRYPGEGWADLDELPPNMCLMEVMNHVF